jgi:type VI secretion system protein ImpH
VADLDREAGDVGLSPLELRDRHVRRPLLRTLFEQAPRFDFFQAVRLLTRFVPRRRPVGHAGTPGEEAVRFSTPPTLVFVPSPVRSLEAPEAPGRPPTMATAVLPLTGPSGALPYRYTEELIERARLGDGTPAAFLDLFNHRLTSLFYRAWEKHRPALALERSWDVPVGLNGESAEGDRFAGHLLALAGLGAAPPGPGDARTALLPFAGLLADHRRTAFGLEALLKASFGLPVTVVPFIPRRLVLEDEDRSTLGLSGRHNALGVDLMAGGRVWDVSGTFRLRIGPLTSRQFRALTPGAPTFVRLCGLTRVYVGVGLSFEVQPVLRAPDVPDCLITSAPGRGRRLGREAWLKSRGRARDADEAVFASGP